jgi:hypothetical protein
MTTKFWWISTPQQHIMRYKKKDPPRSGVDQSPRGPWDCEHDGSYRRHRLKFNKQTQPFSLIILHRSHRDALPMGILIANTGTIMPCSSSKSNTK